MPRDDSDFLEGVVHGHIHNYNNMTYIHGHIHHTIPIAPDAIGLQNNVLIDGTVQSETYLGNNENIDEITYNRDLKNNDNTYLKKRYLDCQHFEFMDYSNNTSGNLTNSMLNNSMNNTYSDALITDGLLNNNVQYNETLPEINNGKVRKNSHILFNDDMMNLPLNKKKKTKSSVGINSKIEDDCDCSPKMFEICCDVTHDKETKENEVDTISLNANQSYVQHSIFDGVSNSGAHTGTQFYPTNNKIIVQNGPENIPIGDTSLLTKHILDINCDLTCEPFCSGNKIQETNELKDPIIKDENKSNPIFTYGTESDDMLDKFCKECHKASNVEKRGDNHVCSDSIIKEEERTESPIATMIPSSPLSDNKRNDDTIYHEHVSNKQTDLQILNDLCNISSLYEIPLATHMNHHHHTHTQGHKVPNTFEHDNINRSESFNLLEPLAKTNIRNIFHKNYDTPAGQPSHHHHHKIQIHQHNSNPEIIATNDDKSISYERFRKDYKPTGIQPTNNTIQYNIKAEHQPTEDDIIKMYHRNEHKIIPKKEEDNVALLNTIIFNWNFKKNGNSEDVKCKWDNCSEGYEDIIDLQKHLYKDHIPQYDPTHNTDDSSNNSQFESCNWDHCNFQTNDVCSLVNHVNNVHGINFDMKFVDPNSTSLIEEEKQFRDTHHLYHCSDAQCENPIKREQPDLKSSLETNEICCMWSDCDQKFDTSEHLNCHLEKVHLLKGQSSYICKWKDCNKTFTQRQKILRHLKVHSKFKPYKCNHCDKCFSTEETLKQHTRTHSGEKPYICPICGKSFAASTFLNIHIRTHTGEKPLECKFCHKRFSESSNLNKHVKTHLKEFKCEHCLKSFDTMKKLSNHLRNCRGDVTPPLSI